MLKMDFLDKKVQISIYEVVHCKSYLCIFDTPIFLKANTFYQIFTSLFSSKIGRNIYGKTYK